MKKTEYGLLHIGHDISIKKNDIVGIFNIYTSNTTVRLKEFLKKAEKSGNTISDTYNDVPKSFILTSKEDNNVIFSTISTSGIEKRVNDEYSEIQRKKNGRKERIQ